MNNGNERNSEIFLIRFAYYPVLQASNLPSCCIYSHVQVVAGAEAKRIEPGCAVCLPPGAFALAM